MNRPKGFSLIELLVVIAIIGLLSTMAVVSLNSARTKARDTRRQGDIKALQTAIELYKTNNTSGGDAAPQAPANWAALGTTLASTITTIPMDPNNSGNYAYVYCWDTAASSTSKYLVAATLEQNIDIPSDIDTKPALNTATCVDSRDASVPTYSSINCADSNGGTLLGGSATAFCLGQG